MINIVKECQNDWACRQRQEANAKYRQAVLAIKEALLHEPLGLGLVQLQQKSRLSAKTLKDVLSHTKQICCLDGKYFWQADEAWMTVRFVLLAGNKQYSKEMQFAQYADEATIQQAFCEWKAGLFYGFWEKIDG